MNEVKGGAPQRRVYQGRKAPSKAPAYRPEDEAVIDTSTKRPQPAVEVSDTQLPTRIAVKQTETLRRCVPGHVWAIPAFKWDPTPFGLESEKLNEKVIEARVQNDSLSLFMEDPAAPMIYGVSGAPDDTKAKLFAAYLLSIHLAKVKDARIEWATLYGGFENPIMRKYDKEHGDEERDPTILVISNLTPNATTVKLDKARDLIERFQKIPRIVVSAGEDPISFHSTKLYTPINALAYFSEALLRRRVEII
jgi:hypothetical protein